jgi:hypothetical protein
VQPEGWGYLILRRDIYAQTDVRLGEHRWHNECQIRRAIEILR